VQRCQSKLYNVETDWAAINSKILTTRRETPDPAPALVLVKRGLLSPGLDNVITVELHIVFRIIDPILQLVDEIHIELLPRLQVLARES
jgi:hypothetical protein